MKSDGRSVVAMVLLFTAAAVAMLWGLSLRWQNELRAQVMSRAELRSLQLADAMAGQVAAELALLDHTLLDLRADWTENPGNFAARVDRGLQSLPAGLVSHLTVVSAEGKVIFSSREGQQNVYVGDRPYFQAFREGGDRLRVGAPVPSRLNGRWMVPVGRPLFRAGRFDGEMHLAVSADFLGRELQRLALSPEDTVTMVHGSGRFMARSVNNAAAMGTSVKEGRPFLSLSAGESGTFQHSGSVDEVPRLFGWQRLPETGVIVVVGLAESSVVAPLATAFRRSHWLASVLSFTLVLGGFTVAWLLWRVDQSRMAMAESEQRLKEAQHMAKVGHWSCVLQTGAMIWSDEVYRIFGHQRGAHTPTFDRFLQQVHPGDRERVEALYLQSIKTGEALEVTHRLVLPDGSVKHVRELCVLDREHGQLVRSHGTVQDISEVSTAQGALERLNGELEDRVEDRTRELAALNNELEAFTYSVSHDLRTPLRSIHGFASLLEEESDNLSSDARSHLRRIQDGARRMGLLITDLLTMAHHSRAVVNLERVNVSELALAVVADVERADPGRKVTWAIAPGLEAMADPVLLRVVLQNLLGNAWKYTSQAQDARVALERVVDSDREADGMVEFAVRDNGAGFDMAYVGQLFQPFKRLHAQHEFEGTGVGLASVQRLVQRHGGTVRAEGAVGQGAVFYFTLPQVPPASLG